MDENKNISLLDRSKTITNTAGESSPFIVTVVYLGKSPCPQKGYDCQDFVAGSNHFMRYSADMYSYIFNIDNKVNIALPYSDQDNNDPLFSQILSSFKFTN